ncbi:MAG: hypothetical protein A2053_04680 [Deltaproteobacteria bacterium GWA2_50_8]|nr:MAG: hypothetical protein A2053_04680 [Deltaproteobacteria bacterium GWA2_50_8]
MRVMKIFIGLLCGAGLFLLVQQQGCQRPPPSPQSLAPEPHLRVALQQDPLIVKEINIEGYLMGVLAHEIYADWPRPTLMAQAVASRSYALYRLSHPVHEEFDLSASVSDQVFNPTEKLPLSVIEAVSQTWGQVLLFKGEVIPAFFHSCCGGYTEAAKRVWRWADPYTFLVSQPDSYCEHCKYQDWEYSILRETLAETMRHYGYDLPEGWVLRLRASRESPRIREVDFVLPLVPIHPVRMTGAHFRQILGYQNLKSTLFSLEEDGPLLTFKGHGFGHGVGMCQWGAKGMALEGKTLEDILHFYYPETELKRIY